MTEIFFAILASTSAASLIYYLLNASVGDAGEEQQKLQDRVESLLTHQKVHKDIERKIKFSSIAIVNRLFQRKRLVNTMARLLSISGWNIPVSVFMMSDLLWGCLVYFIVMVTTKSAPLALGAGAFAVFIPYLMLIVKKKKYIEKFTFLFPDALIMMKNALRAGQSIQAAFKIVAEEASYPINLEFSQVVQEIELGSHLNEALNALYRRINTADLRLFVLGIFIQHEIGGNLAELFENTEKTIRERISQLRELSALTAQGKISGIVLILLPLGVASFITVANPSYLKVLIEDPLGRKILTVAIIMQLIGGFIVRKMTTRSILS